MSKETNQVLGDSIPRTDIIYDVSNFIGGRSWSKIDHSSGLTQQKRKKGTYFDNREPFRILRHSWIPTEVEVTREKVGPAMPLGFAWENPWMPLGITLEKNVMWLPRLLSINTRGASNELKSFNVNVKN